MIHIIILLLKEVINLNSKLPNRILCAVSVIYPMLLYITKYNNIIFMGGMIAILILIAINLKLGNKK